MRRGFLYAQQISAAGGKYGEARARHIRLEAARVPHGALYTEYLSPADYGTADLITQTANLLIPLLSLGITDAVFRFAMEETEDAAGVLRRAFFVLLAGSALTGVLALFAAAALDGSAWLIAVFVIASNFHTLASQFVRAKGDMTLCRTGPAQHRACDLAQQPVSGCVPSRRDRLCVIHRAGGPADDRLPDPAGEALAVLQATRAGNAFPDAALLCAADPNGDVLVDHERIGPVHDYGMAGQRGQRHLRGERKAADDPDRFIVRFHGGVALFRRHREAGGSAAHLQFYSSVWKTFVAGMVLSASGVIAFSRLAVRLLAEEEFFNAWQFVPVLCLAMVFASFSTFLSSVYVVSKKSTLSFWTALLGAGATF